MRDQDCPVCGGAAIRSASSPSREIMTGAGELCVRCEQCGEFPMDAGFLGHGWGEVPAAQKKATAAYLKETKDKPGCWRIPLAWNSWKHYVYLGERILSQRSGSPGAPTGDLP
jgi:hypothetical protein